MKLIRITAETILAMFIVMFLVGVELAFPDGHFVPNHAP